MSARKKPGNFVQRLHRKIRQFFNAVTKAFVNWILRSLLVIQRRTRLSQAGFVLPTVVMVVLVVVLLTTAIMIRSFDRSKNASNYRVNEAVLNAASPALDRARSKLNNLFSPDETALKGNTPDETSIAQVFENPKYTFGDETPLKLVDDLNEDNNIDIGTVEIPSAEQLKTAWKFPVDTDNNGKFDSFTLYGIYFRTSSDRARKPLEARARPQFTGTPDACAAGNGGGGGGNGDNGWFPISGQLKKAFFTYVATVPITQLPTVPYKGTVPTTQFETYKGNKGFSALEMQQDQARLALDNNAVWYEDDLIITDVRNFKLNGRIQTNGNLMLGTGDGAITFFQVSSPWSCYYTAQNSKIVVGGNVSANGIAGSTDTANAGNDNVKAHLFKQPKQAFDQNDNANFAVVNSTNVTTKELPRQVALNTRAYAQRLKVLVDGGLDEYEAVNPGVAPTTNSVKNVKRFPPEIVENFAGKYPDGKTLPDDDANNLLEQVIEVYFKERIRRVPFAEVPIDKPELALQVGGAPVTGRKGGANYVFRGGGMLMPPKEWMRIEDPASHQPNGYTNLPLNYTGATMELEQTNPDDLPPIGTETNVGDRILVGNGLPTIWLKPDDKYANPKEGQPVLNGGSQIKWNGSDEPRERQSQAKILDDLGDTSRNGFWEKAAADPKNVPGDEELAGGLRIVTGAGIYIDDLPPAIGTGKRKGSGVPALQVRSFLPEPPVTPAQLKAVNPQIQPLSPLKKPRVVWPDTMPMYQPGIGNKVQGDLQMRATVVYHYLEGDGDVPIACISSYYDPTTDTTAKNEPTLPGGAPKGRSNNGINYDASGLAAERSASAKLRRQAYMVFPDGRWANEPLRKAVDALQQGTSPTDLSFEQKAAIDAANCAFRILASGSSPTTGKVPDGAIRERAFLDARQVKTLHKPDVEFDANGITFKDANPLINRETFRVDPTVPPTEQKVLIADPEQMKIATQATLKSPASKKPFDPVPAEYNLPVEQRQPLEIRVTEIDVEKLRTTLVGTTKDGKPEYLLPNSGIIYATRDDALPDISDVDIRPRRVIDDGASATDFKLDPSRRPNGIRLWSSGNNGGRLSRGTDNKYRPEEKGLILASNLPVYIKGDFNRHYKFGSTADTVEEFVQKLDQTNYNNFYTRVANQPTDFDQNFACRQGSKRGCNPGDQWRAARILSDAVTLLSNNFRDGFRNEGDYDLNNNAGNLAVAARLKNGLWWNAFSPNYVYRKGVAIQKFPIDAEFPEQDTLKAGSSYVMNGVTPIQRRVKFPQYLMEACTKLPVSECGPQDWFVGGPDKSSLVKADSIIGSPLPNPLNSGTTSKPPKGNIFEFSARRVAFKRNEFGELILPDTCAAAAGPTRLDDCDAIPLGLSNANQVGEYGYKKAGGSAAVVPPEVDNALWFWTTSDNTNAKPSDKPSYNNNNLLYYLPDDPEKVSTERQMLLPGTPKFPVELESLDAAFAGSSVLNGKTLLDPSDFAVCIGKGGSARYQVTSLPAACPGLTKQRIRQMWQALNKLTADIPDALDPSVPKVKVTKLWDPATSAIASAKVNVFEFNLPKNELTGTITLEKGNQSDPIFVIRGALLGQKLRFNSVTLDLKGVDPNNIFWFSNQGMRIDGSKLAGNFIGGLGTGGTPIVRGLEILNTSVINGGRFLGFNSTVNPDFAGNTVTALTTTAQPLLVPVLQLHSPEGNPANGTAAFKKSALPGERKWLQKATPTNYNAALIMGDTPVRPYTSGGGENGGGLHNFPRFLENWDGAPATIQGSLIQYTKSKYATGPFDTVDLITKDNSLFFDSPAGTAPDYIQGTAPAVAPDSPLYQYAEAAAKNKAPYYQPPTRNWGYDVGFLSQTADLFSRRFAIPEAGTPNEFFREVSRDDAWVQNLLCAAEKTGTGYEWAIADATQRPNCKRPLGDYNDPTT